MTQDIPLVRSRYVHAFAAVLDRVGAPTGNLLDRVGLTGRVLEHGDAVIMREGDRTILEMLERERQ